MKKQTLNNGLTIIAMNVQSKYASVYIDVGLGSYHEDLGVFPEYDNAKLIGASHFIEHLVFGDTRRYSSDDIAELGVLCKETNACEGTDSTGYWVNHFLPHKMDYVLGVLTSILFGAMFKLDEIELERGVILSEIRRSYDSITDLSGSSILWNLLGTKMYKKHPLRLPLAGTPDNVMNLDRKTLFDLYKRHYAPNNMIACVVGGIDEEATIESVKRHFGHYKPAELPKLRHVDEPECVPSESYENRRVEQNYILCGLRTVAQTSNEFCIQEVVDDILGGGEYARIYKSIRRRGGLAYSPETGYISGNNAGFFWVYSEAPPDKGGVTMVKDIIRENLLRLSQEPVTEKELELSMENLVNGHAAFLTDIDALPESLCWHERIGLGAENLEGSIKKVKQVSPGEIQAFAKRYMNPDYSVIVGIKAG